MRFDINTALMSLVPEAEWTMSNDDYESINWVVKPDTVPTIDEINSEIARIKAEYDANEYQRLRKAEYPPVTDYIDGVVKGDQVQIQAYIDACLAVKAKYPKP